MCALRIYDTENSAFFRQTINRNSLVTLLTRFSSRVKSNTATFFSAKINIKIIIRKFEVFIQIFC